MTPSGRRFLAATCATEAAAVLWSFIAEEGALVCPEASSSVQYHTYHPKKLQPYRHHRKCSSIAVVVRPDLGSSFTLHNVLLSPGIVLYHSPRQRLLFSCCPKAVPRSLYDSVAFDFIELGLPFCRLAHRGIAQSWSRTKQTRLSPLLYVCPRATVRHDTRFSKSLPPLLNTIRGIDSPFGFRKRRH